MMSKLIYLLMDWETFYLLPVLQQVKEVIKKFQTYTIEIFVKIVSNFNLNTITILAKCSISDA